RLAGLSRVAWLRGDIAGAARLAREQPAAWRGLGVSGYLAGSLERFARIVAAAGQGARAARLLVAATALREKAGGPHTPQWRAEIEQAMAPARVALGEAAWAEAFAAGRALPGRRPSPKHGKNKCAGCIPLAIWPSAAPSATLSDKVCQSRHL
ncbi:MAG TPA: hypothetical protein VGP82_17000, partial [Ktedonobacterales bacterium]|nr:hypothetical protein [Ktedonobacterales bacterium]